VKKAQMPPVPFEGGDRICGPCLRGGAPLTRSVVLCAPEVSPIAD
jgi:hypothetical protein